MKVKLISYSQPSEEIIEQGIENVQDLISFAARVSNPSNQNNTETSEKLLKYLIKHKHWSPFEMASVCMEIETTRDIARQILRHRSFSFQEFSQRYADPTDELSGLKFSVREARLQDEKNRQNSIEFHDKNLKDQWAYRQQKVISESLKQYRWAIKNGIAKEQARALLPEGLTMSRLYVNGTIRSWIHYIELRSENGTQKEHMEIAKACAYVIQDIFPIIKEEEKEN